MTNIFALGDTHSIHVTSQIICDIPKNSLILFVGDGGEGFFDRDGLYLELLNEQLKERNQTIYCCRGNHSKPDFFNGSRVYSNLVLAPDYTTIQWRDKKILLVGGATSIDRQARIVGKDYWEDEKFVFDEKRATKADILVTHSAPSYCIPVGINDFVRGWAKADKRGTLLQELEDERKSIDKLVELVNPTLHLHGHFHCSTYEKINGVIHKGLDINEIWQPYL